MQGQRPDSAVFNVVSLRDSNSYGNSFAMLHDKKKHLSW